MIRLPAFTYVAPATVDRAVRAITDAGTAGMLVAGGTDLYPNMKRRQFEPTTLVGLRAIKELRGIGGTPRDGMRVGACTTLTAVATPIHRGRTQQIWMVEITGADGKLISRGQVRLQNLATN